MPTVKIIVLKHQKEKIILGMSRLELRMIGSLLILQLLIMLVLI